MKPLKNAPQAAPSPAAWRSSSATFCSSDVQTNAASPAGVVEPVGRSVLTYVDAAPVELGLQLGVGGAARPERDATTRAPRA